MQASRELSWERAGTAGPSQERSLLLNRRSGWLFPTVGPATTLALAGVFALAAVVAFLAGPLALARVLALTGVSVLLVLGLLRLLVLVLRLSLVLFRGAERSLQRGQQSRSTHCGAGPCEQSRDRRACEYGLCRFRHFQALRYEHIQKYYSGFFEPSVAQPPLPLQEFLPWQPLSLALQPPLPLQEFWPLQACFSLSCLSLF